MRPSLKSSSFATTKMDSSNKYVLRYTNDNVQHSQLKWLQKVVEDIHQYQRNYSVGKQEVSCNNYDRRQIVAERKVNTSVKVKKIVEGKEQPQRGVNKKLKFEVITNKQNKFDHQINRKQTKVQQRQKKIKKQGLSELKIPENRNEIKTSQSKQQKCDIDMQTILT